MTAPRRAPSWSGTGGSTPAVLRSSRFLRGRRKKKSSERALPARAMTELYPRPYKLNRKPYTVNRSPYTPHPKLSVVSVLSSSDTAAGVDPVVLFLDPFRI